MRRLRVLHITPSVRLLGARRSLLTLVRHLAGTRVEPIVLAPTSGPLTEELDKRHLRWIPLRLPPWRKGSSWLTLPSRVARLREICEAERIDVIHCNEIYPNPHAVIASAPGGVIAQSMSRVLHGRLLNAPRIPIVTHMRLSVTPRMIKNYFLDDATRIIAVSQAASADFDQCFWKERKIRVVHNGIDLEEFEDARRRRAEMRRRLGYNDNDFVIGQIGLLMPRKRPRFVIEAAPAILKAFPSSKFLFIGEPSPGQASYLDELKSLAAELNVAGAIQFLPFQRRIADYFGAIDLNLLLSSDEGFGRVVIEAAGASIPTIGSRAGGIPELIEDGVTGMLLGPLQASDEDFQKESTRFVDLVAALALDPDLLKSLGDAANQRAHEMFSAEEYVKGVVGVFDEAVEDLEATQLPW